MDGRHEGQQVATTYVTGLVNQEVLLQNEYLPAENCTLRSHFLAGLRLFDPERFTLARIGKQLGCKALAGGLRGQARHHPGLVPKADRQEIRRIEASRSLTNRA
jgi:hypothetical protein